MIKVSVIIPIYNVEKYLKECLDNVVGQSLKDIEIIIVNDGSTDSSGTIAEDYAKRYENIKVLHKENGGQGSARNLALNIAKGKYIYFQDSDDYIDLDAMERLYHLAEEKATDLICFSAESFYEDEVLKNKVQISSYIRKHGLNEVMSGKDSFLTALKHNEYRTSLCIRFYLREYLEKHHLRFKEGIIQEDEDYGVLSYLYAERVLIIGDVFYHRRIRGNSTMTGRNLCRASEGYAYAWKNTMEFYENCQWSKKEKKELAKFISKYISITVGLYFKAGSEERKKAEKILNMFGKDIAKYWSVTGKKILLAFYFRRLFGVLKK